MVERSQWNPGRGATASRQREKADRVSRRRGVLRRPPNSHGAPKAQCPCRPAVPIPLLVHTSLQAASEQNPLPTLVWQPKLELKQTVLAATYDAVCAQVRLGVSWAPLLCPDTQPGADEQLASGPPCSSKLSLLTLAPGSPPRAQVAAELWYVSIGRKMSGQCLLRAPYSACLWLQGPPASLHAHWRSAGLGSHGQMGERLRLANAPQNPWGRGSYEIVHLHQRLQTGYGQEVPSGPQKGFVPPMQCFKSIFN